MTNHRVTSIGEILFDIYPDYKSLGGAPFNFIFHVKNLTGSGNFISRIGADANGIEILEFLKTHGFSTKYIQIDPVRPTGSVNVTLDEHKIPKFKLASDSAWDFIELTENVKDLVYSQSDLLYFGTLPQRNIISRRTTEYLMQAEIKYFCDLNIRHSFYDTEMLDTALRISNLVKVNDSELSLLGRIFYNDPDNPEKTLAKLISDFKIEMFAVTLGEKGAIIQTANESVHAKHDAAEIVDTVGAGDAFSSMLCIGFLNKWNIDKTAVMATRFASEICSVKGAIPNNLFLYQKFKDEFVYDDS